MVSIFKADFVFVIFDSPWFFHKSAYPSFEKQLIIISQTPQSEITSGQNQGVGLPSDEFYLFYSHLPTPCNAKHKKQIRIFAAKVLSHSSG